MRDERVPGMDHAHYGFAPMPRRRVIRWPGGERVALWIALHVEYWELDPPPGTVRDRRFDGEMGSYFPDYRNYSQRDYGNRVGIFRVLEVLDRHGLRATVAINADACRRYPFIVDRCRERGYEFAAHGTHATRMISSAMDETTERGYIEESIAAVEGVADGRPTGWIGQDFGESARTPELLAAAGIDWLSDWANDDQPYAMTCRRPLVSIPYQAEWDDLQLLKLRRLPQPRYPEVVADAFATLHAEGGESGRSFCLGVHPWLSGQPHRIRYLDEALARILDYDGTWRATAGEIAAHLLEPARA